MAGRTDTPSIWKEVPNARSVAKKCSKCRNDVNFYLGSAVTGTYIAGFIPVFQYRYYALKCPICIYFEPIDKITAKALRR